MSRSQILFRKQQQNNVYTFKLKEFFFSFSSSNHAADDDKDIDYEQIAFVPMLFKKDNRYEGINV